MSAATVTKADVTAEVVALFEKRFNDHVDLDEQPSRKRCKKMHSNGLTADEGVLLFRTASEYYVRLHLEGDIFNLNGSSSIFADSIYEWAKKELKPKYGANLDIEAIADAIDAL